MGRICLFVCFTLIWMFRVSFAQDCTNGFQEQVFECTDGEGCNDRVAVFYPNSSQDGLRFVCGAEEPCCGQLFTSCYYDQGGNCDPFGKKPEFKKELNQLAMMTEILVQACDGRYVPYAPTEMKDARNSARVRHYRDLLHDDIGHGLWR